VSEEDKELELIRQRMLRELMKEAGREEKREAINHPMVVTDANFDDFIRRAPLIVVDCWATWCPPCRLLEPVIEELAKRLAGQVLFGKLDVDENPVTAARFSITEVPTLLVFKEGRFIGKIIGYRPLRELEATLKAYL